MANPNAFARWDIGEDGLKLRKKPKFDFDGRLNTLVGDAAWEGMEMEDIARKLEKAALDILDDLEAEKDLQLDT